MQRAIYSAAETDEFRITADDAGYFAFDVGEYDLEGVTLAELVSLRDLLNGGMPERMLTAAAAWERGDTEPPTFGTTNHVVDMYAAG